MEALACEVEYSGGPAQIDPRIGETQNCVPLDRPLPAVIHCHKHCVEAWVIAREEQCDLREATSSRLPFLCRAMGVVRPNIGEVKLAGSVIATVQRSVERHI